MRVILELLRIIIIFAFLGSTFGAFLEYVYATFGVNTDGYEWMAFSAIIVLLIVLYRNKLQFSGWYKGRGKEKLPKRVSNLLITSSILLLILLPLVSFFFN
ncbi:hypothetical protein V7087_21315 [Neobacillus niacini]|uniref:hypothetical protein n=1 Tax=Neobacillus niacini TaxID=86668 RepID=UPI002FFF2A6B